MTQSTNVHPAKRARWDRQYAKVTLVCNECGKVWRVSPKAADPQCSKCNSVDYEVK